MTSISLRSISFARLRSDGLSLLYPRNFQPSFRRSLQYLVDDPSYPGGTGYSRSGSLGSVTLHLCAISSVLRIASIAESRDKPVLTSLRYMDRSVFGGHSG